MTETATGSFSAPQAGLLPWHNDLWRHLVRVRDEDRLPHALALVGPAGLGKGAFARLLGQSLNCQSPAAQGLACGQCRDCRLADGDAHPDISCVEPEAPGKPLTIDAMRELIEKSVLTAETGRRRVFVLAPADALNTAAANALLKTLEEPTPGTLFVLVTSRLARLPATIRSRCQIVRSRPPTIDEINQWLEGKEQASALRALLPLVGMAPLRAQSLVMAGAGDQPLELGGHLLSLCDGRDSAVTIAGKWAQTDPDWFLTLFWHWLGDLTRLKQCDDPPLMSIPGSRDLLSSLAQQVDLQTVHRLLVRVQALRRELNHNLNPQLMMERLLIDWQRLGRST